MHTTIGICIILLVLGLASCQRNDDAYSHYQELRDAEWKKNEVLAFDIDSSLIEVGKSYDISIGINNNVKYSYKNLWLFIDHTLDSDSTYNRVEKEYKVTDDEGHWLGGGFAFIYQLSIPFEKGYVFREKRRYRVEIRHGMKDEILSGIEKIGVRVTKRN